MTADAGSASDAFAGREVVLAKLDELVAELGAGGADVWENSSLERYLEALQALLGSIEGAYDNLGQPRPVDPWQVMADALHGARYYE
jgi:hypothetical protein